MFKRVSGRNIISVLLVAMLVSSFTHPVTSPNVLFIIVDDLNDWISPLGGHPDAYTPNLDRLAGMGTLFGNAHAQATSCSPSRVSLLSGMLPTHTGIFRNDQATLVVEGATSMPAYFKQQGYRVMGGGKIFHGGGFQPSWDTRYASPENPDAGNYPANGIATLPNELDWASLKTGEEEMSDYKIATWAIEQLQHTYTQPFFLAVGLYRPHGPWYTPEKYYNLYSTDSVYIPLEQQDIAPDVPEKAKQIANGRIHRKINGEEKWGEAIQAYLASVSFADAQIGRILDALETSPHQENTIVVLVSDHGYHLGEKQHWRKHSLWEEATRVPIFIAGPGSIAKENGYVEKPVGLIDIYPTLIELCMLPDNDDLQGNSLVPLLNDPKAAWPHYAITVRHEPNDDTTSFSIRTERWRYTRYEGKETELYDHVVDQEEQVNLSNDVSKETLVQELDTALQEQLGLLASSLPSADVRQQIELVAEPHPIPSSGTLHFSIRVKSDQGVRITIYDVQGRIRDTLHASFMEEDVVYDLSYNLPYAAGIYYLHIAGRDEKLVKSIVVL